MPGNPGHHVHTGSKYWPHSSEPCKKRALPRGSHYRMMALTQDWNKKHPGVHLESPYTEVNHKLAGVKHSLYHPLLPTLRRIEMDTMGHKLSDEHSRTSTPCSPEHFSRCTFTSRLPGEHHLPALGTADTSHPITRGYGVGPVLPPAPAVTWQECPCFTKATDDWSRYISSSGEFQLQDVKKAVLGYSGYAVRLRLPHVTSLRKYCLHHNPSLDRSGQKPLPVETLNTFRTSGNSYSSVLRPWQ